MEKGVQVAGESCRSFRNTAKMSSYGRIPGIQSYFYWGFGYLNWIAGILNQQHYCILVVICCRAPCEAGASGKVRREAERQGRWKFSRLNSCATLEPSTVSLEMLPTGMASRNAFGPHVQLFDPLSGSNCWVSPAICRCLQINEGIMDHSGVSERQGAKSNVL